MGLVKGVSAAQHTHLSFEGVSSSDPRFAHGGAAEACQGWPSHQPFLMLCPCQTRLDGSKHEGHAWHDHKNTDETFIVLAGVLRIDFRDGAVCVSAGEMFVVPKGVEHKPYAEHEVKLLLIEPRGVLNTGHEGGDRTAENDVWI